MKSKSSFVLLWFLLFGKITNAQTYEGYFDFGFVEEGAIAVRPVKFTVSMGPDYSGSYILASNGHTFAEGNLISDGLGNFSTSLVEIYIDPKRHQATVERDGLRDQVRDFRVLDPGPDRDDQNLALPPNEFNRAVIVRIKSENSPPQYGIIDGVGRGGRVRVSLDSKLTKYIHYTKLETAVAESGGFKADEWVSTLDGKRRIIAIFADGEILAWPYVDQPYVKQFAENRFAAGQYHKTLAKRIGSSVAQGWRKLFSSDEVSEPNDPTSLSRVRVTCDDTFRPKIPLLLLTKLRLFVSCSRSNRQSFALQEA